MQISRRGLIATAAALSTLPLSHARAQSKPKITLGILSDLSGPYRDSGGPTSVICIRQAVEEFNAASHGFTVEVLEADHQNKPDVGASIARQWCDQGVDAVCDVPYSSVALAVAEVVKAKDKVLVDASATSTALTESQCSPNTIVWSADTYMFAASSGGAVVKAGGKSWFFVVANYAFGQTLEQQTTAVVTKAGGEVKGVVRYPFPETTDFSGYLVQAQASGAQVLGLATAGADTVNSVKQAHEFGLNRSMKIAPLTLNITDVHGVGLETAEGLYVTESFYWDLNDRTRAFAARVFPKTPKNMPNEYHASCYSSTLHYLKTAAAMGAEEAKKSGRATVLRMKALPTDDDAFGQGSIRSDGRGAFPAYLFKVKSLAESKGEWDVYTPVATTPPSEALHPLVPACDFKS